MEAGAAPGAWFDALTDPARLSQVLRWAGSLTLLAAALRFLLQDFVLDTPYSRCIGFLAFTVVLSGAGWFCARVWREAKSGRTFLALAAAFVPANMAQIGGIAYATYHGQASLFDSTQTLFRFDPLGGLQLGLLLATALPLLGLVSWMGLAALNRPQARWLFPVFAVLNASVLLPWRGSTTIGLMALAGYVVVELVLRLRVDRDARTALWDSVLARAMLIAPLFLLLGRTLTLHVRHWDNEPLFFFAVFAVPGLVAHVTLARTCRRRWSALLWKILPLPLLFGAWAVAACNIFDVGERDVLWLLIAPFTVMLMAGTLWTRREVARPLRAVYAWTFASIALLYLFADGGNLSNQLMTLSLGAGGLVWAINTRHLGLLRPGVATLFIGLAGLCVNTVGYVNEWLAIGASGCLVLLLAAWIERSGGNLRSHYDSLKQQLASWR